MVTKDIVQLPPLILGGATLNSQYNDDPRAIPIVKMLKYAFSNGINAIDTSPYYGPSEIIYGEALDSIRDEWPRESYFICTKVGRVQLEEFDYSKEHVRFSVLRSCERLKTSYLDMLYLHDVEFVEEEKIWEALGELKKLKDEGIISNFGISGYPVEFLYQIAKECCNREEIGPLDNILSYCNLNLQNLILESYYDKFMKDCHLKTLCNGSILAMSLLTKQETKSFHPCPEELKRRCADAAQYLDAEGEDIADLASKFSIARWRGKGPTVLGCSNVPELEHALNNYKAVIENDGLTEREKALVEYVQKEILGNFMNYTWKSGIH